MCLMNWKEVVLVGLELVSYFSLFYYANDLHTGIVSSIVFVFCLPETRGVKLSDTMDEQEEKEQFAMPQVFAALKRLEKYGSWRPNLFVDWVGGAAQKRSEQKFWCWDDMAD
ncbi:hypothetical protein OIU84_026524 [Salix udensis]|uniref:Uncharacterized protein n=1 Tax=Salix udensis TaxID=889485 RepID=A0AAD6KM25_9ROSI|nr:hypothetical protein OIU84_026524 [Salix udensis]